MGAVANGAALAGLAATKGYPFGRFRRVEHGFNAGAFVGTIAKRLRLAATTGTPIIGFAFFYFLKIGEGLGYYRIGH